MALLPPARSFKDAPSMPLPRRTQRQSRAWQVEPLEPRALLTTVYGPASFEAPSISPEPHTWGRPWAAEFASFAGTMPSPPPRPAGGMNLARSAIQARSGGLSFASASASDSISFVTFPGPPPGLEPPRMIESWRLDQRPDDMGPPSPFFAFTTRGASGNGPSDRGFMTFSIITRSRDEMNRGIPRLGLSPRPFFLPISPESYWEDGVGDNSAPLFWLSENVSQSGPPNVARVQAEPGPNARGGQSQTPAATNLSTLASSSATSVNSVMIWVDAEAWAGEISLASIVLSRGEFEPGALFPEEDLPELTAILSSLLNEWLGETAELSFPLAGPLQQVTKLDPLDESSLALTATLLTVSSAPQPTTKPGPGSGPGSGSASAATDASLPAPPSWAGFVIGLDEAFEANRQAVRRWPAAEQPTRASEPGDEASAPPPTVEGLEPTAVDKAIENLDREPPPPSPLDELLLRVLEDAEADEHPPQDKSWRDAAGPASLSLAIIPALWAERLDLTPRSSSVSSVRRGERRGHEGRG